MDKVSIFHSEKKAKRFMKYLTVKQIIAIMETGYDKKGLKIFKVTQM